IPAEAAIISMTGKRYACSMMRLLFGMLGKYGDPYMQFLHRVRAGGLSVVPIGIATAARNSGASPVLWPSVDNAGSVQYLFCAARRRQHNRTHLTGTSNSNRACRQRPLLSYRSVDMRFLFYLIVGLAVAEDGLAMASPPRAPPVAIGPSTAVTAASTRTD